MTSLRLVKSELLKIRTTNAWWLLALAAFFADGVALAVTMLRTHFILTTPAGRLARAATPEQLANAEIQRALRTNAYRIASDVFTAGDLIGGLLAMLLGILLVTNEYHHQTATTTFLVSPKRTPVIVAKLVAAVLAAGVLWSIGVAVDVPAGIVFFGSEGLPTHLGEWEVIRSMLLELMVYALWAVFGLGLGALIRNQLAATVIGSLGYLVGGQLAQGFFLLVHRFWIKEDWVLTAMVVVPAHAATIAITPTKTYAQSAPQWVGAAVLLGYGLVFGAIGAHLIRRRDVA